MPPSPSPARSGHTQCYECYLMIPKFHCTRIGRNQSWYRLWYLSRENKNIPFFHTAFAKMGDLSAELHCPMNKQDSFIYCCWAVSPATTRRLRDVDLAIWLIPPVALFLQRLSSSSRCSDWISPYVYTTNLPSICLPPPPPLLPCVSLPQHSW